MGYAPVVWFVDDGRRTISLVRVPPGIATILNQSSKCLSKSWLWMSKSCWGERRRGGGTAVRKLYKPNTSSAISWIVNHQTQIRKANSLLMSQKLEQDKQTLFYLYQDHCC